MNVELLSFNQYSLRLSSTKLKCFATSVINNDFATRPSTAVSEKTTTSFVLIRTHQAGIVARHCCWGLTKWEFLSALHWSDRLWAKVRKNWRSQIVHSPTSKTLSAYCEILVSTLVWSVLTSIYYGYHQQSWDVSHHQ